jgi:endonuclease G
MIVRSVPLQRWQQQPAESLPAVHAPAGRRRLEGSAEGLARRISFLSAEGQQATLLEQEAILGSNDMVEASFLDRCALVTGCVGRLRFQTPRGRAFATGFMVAPGLVMTNHHVFGDATAAQGAALEFDYRYDLAGQVGVTQEFDLRPDQFFVADAELDFAVVAVAPASTAGAALDARGYLRLNPESGKVAKEEFVTIVQHPDGLPMRIALRENQIIRAEAEESVVWYRADTAHGSSGAPVFNDSFQLAALHSSGRIQRNANGEYALARGGWAPSLEGLSETDVVWEANVGTRVSRICAVLVEKARARSAAHAQEIEAAMQGGDVLSAAIARLKGEGAGPATSEPEGKMEAPSGNGRSAVVTTASPARVESGIVIPLQLRISLEASGATAAVPLSANGTRVSALESEAAKMQIPIIYDGLDEREGFNRGFLKLDDDADVPMPKLTHAGEQVAAPLLDGSGSELRYHKFSIWMHAQRRLALFTASNVDWRARKKIVDGKKVDRDTLAGFPPNEMIFEEWVTDARIAATHQLPDVFYTADRGAFDKGHLVRRDDVCWGTSFEDIQMGNGDTYHVTNCSPQTKPFNQGKAGEENWGDLESYVQMATKKDTERAVIYAGPIFKTNDRWFRGKDDAGNVRVQIPRRYWKIIVVKGDDGPAAYGFVLEQDVRAVTEQEFFVTEEWIGSMQRIKSIESLLRGWISFGDLKGIDQYDAVHG